MNNNKLKKYISELEDSNVFLKRKTNPIDRWQKSILESIEDLDPELVDKFNELIEKYNVMDNDENTSACTIIRDSAGKILKYSIVSRKKNRMPFIAELSRAQAEHLFASYSIYGLNLPKAAISPDFEVISTHGLSRVIKAMGIYKYDTPFAPHQIEELSEDELLEIHRNLIETKITKKLEKQKESQPIVALNKMLEKTYIELATYKNLTNNLKDIKLDFSNYESPKYTVTSSDKDLMLHLADFHIGAKCESYSLYENPYDKGEIKRRLDVSLQHINELGTFDTIVVNILGDMIDGMDNQTARRDHYMPQCMDNKEQFQTYLELMIWYIGELKKFCNKLKVYCVPCGNHGGDFEWGANIALQNQCGLIHNDVNFTLFNTYFGNYKFKNATYLICHGKDAKFMKKPMSLELTDKTKNFILEFIRKNNLCGNIHVIKGDLHSGAISSCEAFTYRNVLSLFGASDYSAYNYTPNSYGISYELFINNQMLNGNLENL